MTKLLHFNKWYLPLLIVLFGGFVKPTNLHAQSMLPEGALNGLFSVSENTQVRFSQGNLQYKASTNTWRFAANQYDYIGDANSNISSTYSGYIDLFGWGTSGYYHGATCYQPWSTSTSKSDYYAYGSYTYNLYDQTGRADWGYNAISNGGNQEDMGWRTLTHEEWVYMFDTRSTPSGIRYAMAKVNNVNGVILLPDDWQSSYYSLNSTNTANASFSSNTITASQWATLEQQGAAFLPAAGRRYGTSVVNNVGSNGYYWSSSYNGSNSAWDVSFYDSRLDAGYYDYRNNGQSVRLVVQGKEAFNIINFENGSIPADWNNSGSSYPWTIWNSNAHGGSYCMASSNYHVANSESYIEATVEFTKNGSISFYSRVSSESASYDYGCFYIDGAQKLSEGGTANTWTAQQYDVTAGTHTFRWYYRKDSSVDTGEDRYYIDDITFIGAGATSQEGALNGIFSVREGYQVYFSQGNLQYKASTNTWRFAANQYDYIGDANSSISSTYSNYIDLFGWGTSGYNHGADCYQPWSTSEYSDYYAYGSATYNLFDQTGKADWGYNAISNGGNQQNKGWRTLTHEEWVYLFNTRSTSSGIRYAKATVNNVSGVILLPDDWQSSYYSLSSTNTSGASFSSNTITASQWTTLEQHGAAFLPAAGYRSGIIVGSAGSCGHYWSSSYSDSSSAWYVFFGGSNLVAGDSFGRGCGQSVRLVFPSQGYSFGISASPSPVEGGTVSGAGIYPEGAECSLIATASTGYHFVNWTENGTLVSTNSTYTFTVTGNRTLVANFANSSSTSQEGALSGVFSVRDGYQVYFSQGNLQYKASTNTWRFAANQYDYIGDANSNISSTYSNYIDLFGWGTSSYNHGSVCYQPWSTSTSYSDYYAYGSLTYNLFDQTGKADWGYNAISNGGNQANRGWRTLTKEEWDYVFNTRITPSGIRYAKAKVNNVNGVILLPDDWQSSYYSLSSTNTSSASFSSNTITASQWATLEQHGAVFLPAAGRRSGTSVSYGGSSCNYWSSSCNNSNYAWDVYIDNLNVAAATDYHRYIGHSVRLVFPSQGYSFGINASPSPVEGGTVSGAGIYPEGAECSLIATASTGYHFVNWTENGTQVSTSATYTFRVTGDRTLVANFAPNTYTVTLNTNNGTINSGNVTSYTYGVGATLPTNVTRTGYTFGGWYANSGLTGTAVTSISTTATGDKTFWAKWTINSYTIGASANPTAGGTVSGAGSYNYGASCTLVATPATGYNFTKWTKNGTQVSTSASYTFTVNGAATYVAQFTKKTYTITATANPTAGGTITGAGTYEHGASCTLVATPSTGYHFVNWTQNGTQVSTNASYQFTVTGGKTLVANFAPNTYTVTLNTNNGTINSGNVTSYTYGEGATLPTDVTRTGYTFGGWYDNANLSGTAVTSISTTATGDKTFWAKWTINSYAIGASANPTAGGTVSGAGTYNYGASCTLVATPATGYNFTKWTKNNTQVSTSASYTFTVTEAADYVAVFTKKTYSIVATANPTAGGTITGAGTYEHGSSCTLVATPATGYSFVNWTSGNSQVSTNASYQFTVTGARTLVANFAPNTYTVTLNTNNGTINSGNVTSYTYGEGATLPTDVTRTGYTFGGWYDNANLSGTAVTSISTTATGDKTFWAKWTINSYAIGASANPTAGGTVSGAGSYNYGASCTLTAMASDTYTFVNWTIDGEEVSDSPDYTFIVTGSAEYVANFMLKSYSITAKANPTSGGAVSGGGYYSHGSSCTLTAVPYEGYYFINWTKNGTQVSDEPSFSFEVISGGTYVAQFGIIYYEVAAYADPDEGGSVTGADTYRHGTTCTLNATASEGYSFVNWTKDGESVSTNPIYSFTVLDNTELVAHFNINSYVIEASANPTLGGTVAGAGTYNHFESCLLTATANEGYTFVNWTENGNEVSTDATLQFTVTGGRSLVANFSLNSYEVTVSANPIAGGTVTGAGTYNHFGSCTLTATANEGYTFVNWTENGNEVSSDASYSFQVTGERTLVANFSLNSYDITASANPNEGGMVTGAGTYNHFENCTLTATANEGYNFVNWTKDGNEVSTDAVFNFIVTGLGDYVAHFELKTCEITASADPEEGGTVTGAGTYTHGETVTLTATANEGYLFDGWVKDEETVSTEPSLSFTAIEDGEYVAQFTHQSYPIEIMAFPTEGGTVTGAGTYYHGDICTLTATPNTGYVFLYWIKDGVQVSTEASYTFTVTGPATYVANFVNFNYEVSVVVNPAEAGTVQGAGNYDLGLTCTLTATPNEGYQFVNWTVNGEEVSADLEYSFTVTEPVAVEANFRVDAEYHEFSLTPGWNWWSTYIEMNGVNGLALLEDALGTSGIQIKSQSSFVTYDEGWFGTLNGIVNEQSYRINMGEGGDYSLAGTIADPTAHPIAICSGWNWIGYVENVEMDLNTAMANLDKSGDDIVKSRDCFSTYYAGYGWWGTLESLQPGGGYMYKASASGTLVYPETSKAEAFIHSPEAATWWNPDGGSYADNMSVMAVVEVNGEEVRSEEVELGAFSQGECRGAVRLLYVAPLDRYVAFLTVHGEDGDELGFRLQNDERVLFASDRAVFAKDAVLGSTTEPYVLRFRNTGVTDAANPVVTAYPNPSTGVFQLEGEGMERVEVYTMLGELVRVEEVHTDTHTLNLSGCAEGMYHLRVHTQNGLKHLSVVVAE